MNSSTTYATKPPCTHREELPVRECRSCGAYLRTGNTSTTCSPCGTPPWEIVDEDLGAPSFFGALAEAPLPVRNHVADALQRIWEMTPA